jgi:hypothetical protein
VTTPATPPKRGRPVFDPVEGTRIKATYKLPASTIRQLKELAAKKYGSQSNAIVAVVTAYIKAHDQAP